MHDIKQTLEFILQSISPNDIDKISVESHEENGLTILEIISTPEVTGQIIGKEAVSSNLSAPFLALPIPTFASTSLSEIKRIVSIVVGIFLSFD
jgi:hypothetical protein